MYSFIKSDREEIYKVFTFLHFYIKKYKYVLYKKMHHAFH